MVKRTIITILGMFMVTLHAADDNNPMQMPEIMRTTLDGIQFNKDSTKITDFNKEHLTKIKNLLEQGADPEATDSFGTTIEGYLSIRSQKDPENKLQPVYDLLEKAKSEIEERIYKGRSSGERAAKAIAKNHVNRLKKLLEENKALVNHRAFNMPALSLMHMATGRMDERDISKILTVLLRANPDTDQIEQAIEEIAFSKLDKKILQGGEDKAQEYLELIAKYPGSQAAAKQLIDKLEKMKSKDKKVFDEQITEERLRHLKDVFDI